MKKITLLLVLAVTFSMSGCIWSEYQAAVNTTDVIVAIDQFDDVKETINNKREVFTDEEWEKLQAAKVDFDDIADSIVATGRVSLSQLKLMRDSVKTVYQEIQTIVYNNLSSFSVYDRINLQSFHERMVRIDSMITELEESPSAEKMEETLEVISSALQLGIQIAPLLK